MPTPHDYYDIHGMPRLHNVGEGRPYLENDYHANDHGPQVPSLSTIGRGPRGEGLKVGNVVNENGTVSFALYSDLTDELVWQSPNLDPGTLDFYPADFRDLTAGQPAPMDIVHTRGGVTKTTTAYLPCGERGSLVFLLGGRSVPRVPSDTYQTTAEELMIYGHRTWPNDNKPLPHVNDIVFFRYTDDDETGFAFGTIETVGTRNNEETVPSTPIVYTARVFVPCTGGEGEGCDCDPRYDLEIRFNSVNLLEGAFINYGSYESFFNKLMQGSPVNVKVDQLNAYDHAWYREYAILHIAADNYYYEDIEILIVNTDEHKYYLLTVTESNEVTVTEVERPI